VPQATRVLGNSSVAASRMEGELPRTMPVTAAAAPVKGMVARK
jgi:hypothetical protein